MSRESGSTSSWRLSTLGEIALHDGLQTGPFGSQLHASDYSSKGIPVVMPRDMVGFRISTTTINRTSEETANKLARHLLKAGDIIFARRGEIGRCALVSSDEDGWLCGTGSLRVRLRQDEVLPEFLIQYLNLPHAITWLTSNAVGQTMLNLSTSILSELPINVPPLLEQRKIADILGTWDTAIGTLERLITVLQKRKRGLMQRALTGQVRFPEYQGCQWKEVRLGDVFTERRETGRIDLPLLSITSKQGVIPRDSVERRDTSSEDKSKYLRICKGDLGYNTMRMW